MTAPTLHAQVLALRRTHSARAVAQALNIPLGTVKAISSRAGLTRDNANLREFSRLPEPTSSTCTALHRPVAPPEPVAVTGFLLPWGHHHVNLIDGQFVSILKTLANAGAVSMKHRICRDAVTGRVTAKTALLRRVFPTVFTRNWAFAGLVTRRG